MSIVQKSQLSLALHRVLIRILLGQSVSLVKFVLGVVSKCIPMGGGGRYQLKFLWVGDCCPSRHLFEIGCHVLLNLVI